LLPEFQPFSGLSAPCKVPGEDTVPQPTAWFCADLRTWACRCPWSAQNQHFTHALSPAKVTSRLLKRPAQTRAFAVSYASLLIRVSYFVGSASNRCLMLASERVERYVGWSAPWIHDVWLACMHASGWPHDICSNWNKNKIITTRKVFSIHHHLKEGRRRTLTRWIHVTRCLEMWCSNLRFGEFLEHLPTSSVQRVVGVQGFSFLLPAAHAEKHSFFSCFPSRIWNSIF
jgi:hypothetical protein